jgi:hypothetical protein
LLQAVDRVIHELQRLRATPGLRSDFDRLIAAYTRVRQEIEQEIHPGRSVQPGAGPPPAPGPPQAMNPGRPPNGPRPTPQPPLRVRGGRLRGRL